jgi:opacity protein-like surface antigen
MSTLSAYYGSSVVDPSYLLDIGGGYKFNNWFRADVTGEYRSSGLYRASNYYTGSTIACVGLPTGTCGDNYRGQTSIGLFLANAYLDLGTWYGITPYVGGGVGVAAWSMGSVTDQSMQVQIPNGLIGSGSSSATAGLNFAWALMGGAAWDLSHNLKLDVGYRYVNMGTINTGTIECNGTCWYEAQHFKLASNDVRVGLRWLIDPRSAVYDPGAPVTRSRY